MREMVLHHVCIQTNCYAESLEFYSRLLDMEIIEETPNFHGRAYNTWLKREGFMIELQTPKRDEIFEKIDAGHNGIAHMCFWVSDIEAKYVQLCRNGIDSFLTHGEQAIYEVNGGKLFKVKAPEGTIIEFRDKKEC